MTADYPPPLPPTLASLFPTHLIETRKIIAAHSTKCHSTQSTQASSQASKALGQRITHSTDDPYALLLYSFSLSLSLPPLPVSSPRATKQVHYILARWQRLSCLIKTNQVNEHEFITHPQPQDRRTDTHTNTHTHTPTHKLTGNRSKDIQQQQVVVVAAGSAFMRQLHVSLNGTS